MENQQKEEYQEQAKSIAKEQYKRHIAYKYRIGTLLQGKPIIENERLRFLELSNKEVIRVNVIANVVDKFIQEGEKKFASVTLDDGTGQIRVKTFGDEIARLAQLQQGDTILLIGMVRYWSDEVYLTPEIIKKKDPAFLLLRKLELEAEEPQQMNKAELMQLKDKILQKVKEAESNNGIETEKIIMELKELPATINQEIKRLLEEGMVYEPRPGKLRYLG